MSTPGEELAAALYRCMKLDAQYDRTAGRLVLLDGHYRFAAERVCHPLESVLLGQPRTAPTWQQDVAVLLGVDQDWVDGSLDGFAGVPSRSLSSAYDAGFLVASDPAVARMLDG